jgi:hypothetical protein
VATLLATLTMTLVGCSDEMRVPVSGKVFLENRPLERGTVVFHPESAGDDRTSDLPAGEISEDGTYQLYTHYQRGALPGTYRVVVSAYEGNTPVGQPPKCLVPARYLETKTSELRVEVVKNPAEGAYDLRLKR